MGTAGQSITLANSIIGVGILAMPFCFQQCGVVLATVILLFMGLISRLCCYFLLKAALMARRRNFEFLAFHIFGSAGKLAVEVGIIGFLMGTCIAYFVVVGDLGPQIIAKLFNINQSDILRTSIMVVVSLVCVLPLGLLRNVDSLSNVSAATIGFYFCLVIKVIAEAGTQMFSRDWHLNMEMWKPSGVLQCVPIFSMALFCQTQLFEIFESLPTLSLEKMNVVTKNAINICTAVYFTLGLFGYIAFGSHVISGNVLMSLSPTMASDVIKLGFVMSVAFSFPLIIFPCRASLYSFLYRRAHPAHHDHIINHSIPETTFRCITVGIIIVSLCVSLVIPNIELVLGLVGATIGVLVCVVFPAAAFLNLTSKNNNDRLLAKGVLILGLVILVLGTYANLQAAESQRDRYDNFTPERIDKIVEDFFDKMEKQDHNLEKILVQHEEKIKSQDVKDSVIQPPNPVPPESKEKEQENKLSEVDQNKINPAEKPVLIDIATVDKVSETHPKNLQTKLDEFKSANGVNKDPVIIEPKDEKANSKSTQDKIDKLKQQNFIETIKQHRDEQKELIEEQKEILDELIKTKNELKQSKKEKEDVEAKKIAVESIQKIADIAIKKLSAVSEKPEDAKSDIKNEPLENIANEVVQQIAKKAVEAIEEISEQKPAKQNDGKKIQSEALKKDTINSIPDPNNLPILQPDTPNKDILPSVSNFAPINPPVTNQKPANLPNPQLSPSDQKQNIAPAVEANNVPVISNNVPLVNPRPILNQIVNNIPPPVLNQKMPEKDQAQQMPLLQQNQNNEQPNGVVSNLEQNQLEPQKRSVDDQIIQKDQKTAQDQVDQQLKNDQKNVPQKSHSHSPDEPQSYKQGEDSQKHEEIANNVAQNVPIPIAMNGNAQASQKQTQTGNKDTIAQLNQVKDRLSDDKVQSVQNNGAKNVNGGPRQKREVFNKLQTKLQKDEEICTKSTENKEKLNSKTEKTLEKILPSNVNLAEVGLNKLPIDFIHVGRSLKSIDELEKKR